MPAVPITVPGPRSERERELGPVLPLARILPGPVHYVMAGGGAHGAVQWGLLQALSQTDLRPDMIVGTSAGALTGSILAEDFASGVNRIAYVWAQLDRQAVLGEKWLNRRLITSARQAGLLPNGPEQGVLDNILEARTFEELEVPFAAVATDLATGLPAVHTTGELIPALLASSAIPGVFPPVEIDGRLYVDGLASANLPAVPALELGAGSVVVLDTGTRRPAEVGTSAKRVLGRVAGIMAAGQRRRQLRDAAASVPVVLLPTPNDLGGSLDFGDTMPAAAYGYSQGRSFLTDLCALGPLEPGLYGRSDDHEVAEELAEVFRAVDP